ncbi:hypothetical protein PCHDK_000512600, partial [Plasmodium chabaudi adami]
VHVYNPNLVVICQHYKKKSGEPQKYFYALAAKAEISKDKTIIAMTSVNVTDGNNFSEGYKNPIIGVPNSFYAYINPEDYIASDKYKKVFVNLAGYLIEKKGDDLEVTYIESIEGHSSI